MKSSVPVVISHIQMSSIPQSQFRYRFISILGSYDQDSISWFVFRVWVYAHVENFFELKESAVSG